MPAPPEGLASDIARLALRDPVSALKIAVTSLTTLPARFGVAPPRGLFTADVAPEVLEAAQVHRADESLSALLQLLVGSRVPVQKTEIPTLVVGGTQDGLVPPARVRLLADRLGSDHLDSM